MILVGLNNILFGNRNTYTKIYIVLYIGSDSKRNAYMKVLLFIAQFFVCANLYTYALANSNFTRPVVEKYQ